MKRWANFSILLLQLPFAVRLVMVLLVFLLCLLIAALSMPMTHSADIVVIPVAMAAWFFGYRGMLLFSLVTMITMILAAIFIRHVSFTSLPFYLVALTGMIVLMAIGFMVAYLRSIVDIIETARRKAIVAEEQLQAAYEQQQQLFEQKERFLTNYKRRGSSGLLRAVTA